MRRFIHLFKQYPKNLWVLALGLMINVTGTSFIWPLTTIYINQVLGRPVTTAGTVLLFQAGSGMLGSLIGGILYDKIGGKKTILIGVFSACLSVFVIAITQIWPVYVTMMILLGFSTGIIFPAVYAMAGGVWPEGGRKAFNVMYLSQNIGVALGSALGGIVAQYSFTLTFLINGFTYLLFALLVFFGLSPKIAVPPRGIRSKTSNNERESASPFAGSGFISLLVLCLGFMSCWITYVQWQSTTSVHMGKLGIPLSAYSLLWTINGLMILLIQPFRSWITERYIRSIRQQLLFGVLFFVLAFLLLSRTQAYSGFVAGMVIMTIGEIFIWPGVPAAADRLAPEGRAGFYQGMVNSFATAGRMLGPLTGGFLYEHFSPQVLYYAMVGFCLFAFINFSVYEPIGSGRGIRKTSNSFSGQ